MPIILNTIYPEKDELLLSWLNRLAEKNATDFLTFFSSFSFSNPDRCNAKLIPSVNFSALYSSLSTKNSLRDLFLNTTLFSYYSPFLPEYYQLRRQVPYFYPTSSENSIFDVPIKDPAELRFCPECQKEELSEKGYCYYHKIHQISYITSCPKHKCTLQTYSAPTYNVISGKCVESKLCTPILNDKTEAKIAAFTESLSELKPDMNSDDMRKIIYNRIRELGLYDRKNHFNGLKDRIIESGFDKLIGSDMNMLIRNGLVKHMLSADIYLPFLAVLYPNFDEVKSVIPKKDYSGLVEKTRELGYSVVGEPRYDITEFCHNKCGTHFCLPFNAVLSGFICPECGKKLSEAILFKNLVEHYHDNQYTLLSEYKSLRVKVKIRHRCGLEQEYSPDKFLYGGQVCPCEIRPTKEKYEEEIKKYPGFELESYDGKNVTLKHIKCGKSFTIRMMYFRNNPYCRVCETRTREGRYGKIVPVSEIPEDKLNREQIFIDYINGNYPVGSHINVRECQIGSLKYDYKHHMFNKYENGEFLKHLGQGKYEVIKKLESFDMREFRKKGR